MTLELPSMPIKGPIQSGVAQALVEYFGLIRSEENQNVYNNYSPPNIPTVPVGPPPSLPLPLAGISDIDNLSPYQCLLREQIELFETNEDYLSMKAQGRNNPIELGQVGIRCRHCACLTKTNQLKSSAIQFSMSINGIYQVALKMGRMHIHSCRMVPDNVKKQLLELKAQPRKRARGRQYWKEMLEAQGLVEDGTRIRFNPPPPPQQQQQQHVYK